jgi:hypothetical protein
MTLCAYGAMFDETVFLPPGRPRFERGTPFYLEARKLLNDVMNQPSVLHVYGLFVLQCVCVSKLLYIWVQAEHP